MIVTWTIEGTNWQKNIKASINSNPTEIATQCIENLINSLEGDEDIEFGAILIVHHDKMKSEDEYLVLYTPHVLANAGYYSDAEELKIAAEKEFT
jgi:hypothetical protein